MILNSRRNVDSAVRKTGKKKLVTSLVVSATKKNPKVHPGARIEKKMTYKNNERMLHALEDSRVCAEHFTSVSFQKNLTVYWLGASSSFVNLELYKQERRGPNELHNGALQAGNKTKKRRQQNKRTMPAEQRVNSSVIFQVK